MAKIDTSGWKKFLVGKLFDVVKGTRLTKANMIPGDIRFIGSSAMNNGCTAMVGRICTQPIQLPYATTVVLVRRSTKTGLFSLRMMSMCCIQSLI